MRSCKPGFIRKCKDSFRIDISPSVYGSITVRYEGTFTMSINIFMLPFSIGKCYLCILLLLVLLVRNRNHVYESFYYYNIRN